jgi:hypothetical protein
MEVERNPVEEATADPNQNLQQQLSGTSGRLSSIVLTSPTNLILLQRQIKNITTGNFEFRSIRNGTRIITKEMADFSDTKTFLKITFPISHSSQNLKTP